LRTDRLLLGDILEEIGEAISTTPPTKVEFDADKLVQSHLVCNIQIIGEATWRFEARRVPKIGLGWVDPL
jgi:uncharacterized protein with HEPN domain